MLIDKEISKQYEFKIKGVIPYRDVYILDTSKGKKILKMTGFSPQRVLFVHGAKEHLYNKGFRNVDRYMCTTDGKPYIVVNEDCYTVTDMVDGRGINLDSRSEVIAASRLLASMHKASKGFLPHDSCLVQDELGKLPQYFEKRLAELRRLKKFAAKRKTDFDFLFMQYVDYFYNLGNKALDRLYKSPYIKLVGEARTERNICHRDFTHHNIIYHKNQFYIVNFDYCCYDLKLYDLTNFIRRKMRKCNWNIDEAKIILDYYVTIESLSNEELEVLGVMLMFPQKFWRTANRYYNSKRSWAERNYMIRLKEVIDEMEGHREFIEKYSLIYF